LCSYEVNLEEGYIFMLMELGDIDLEEVLDQWKGQKKNMTVMRMYWEQMLSAVQIIHEERIVHCDLKPANFLLVHGHLKLIDFGVAKRIPSGSTESYSHHQVGTVNYMSPESLRDTRDNQSIGRVVLRMGLASDVWSLGCILYQMLYDHPPFREQLMRSKIREIMSESSVIDYP
ncbi:kinase-like domain-containing protein, partial [Piptocephalis cylindrospora]